MESKSFRALPSMKHGNGNSIIDVFPSNYGRIEELHPSMFEDTGRVNHYDWEDVQTQQAICGRHGSQDLPNFAQHQVPIFTLQGKPRIQVTHGTQGTQGTQVTVTPHQHGVPLEQIPCCTRLSRQTKTMNVGGCGGFSAWFTYMSIRKMGWWSLLIFEREVWNLKSPKWKL